MCVLCCCAVVPFPAAFIAFPDISLPLGVQLNHDDTDLLESVDPRETSKNDKAKWVDFALEDILEPN